MWVVKILSTFSLFLTHPTNGRLDPCQDFIPVLAPMTEICENSQLSPAACMRAAQRAEATSKCIYVFSGH